MWMAPRHQKDKHSFIDSWVCLEPISEGINTWMAVGKYICFSLQISQIYHIIWQKYSPQAIGPAPPVELTYANILQTTNQTFLFVWGDQLVAQLEQHAKRSIHTKNLSFSQQYDVHWKHQELKTAALFQRQVTDLQTADTIPVAILVQAKGDGLEGVTMHSMHRYLHQATAYIALIDFYWLIDWIFTFLFSTCRPHRDRQKPANGTQCPTLTTDS